MRNPFSAGSPHHACFCETKITLATEYISPRLTPSEISVTRHVIVTWSLVTKENAWKGLSYQSFNDLQYLVVKT